MLGGLLSDFLLVTNTLRDRHFLEALNVVRISKTFSKSCLGLLDEIEDLVYLLVKLLYPFWFPFYLFLLLVASLSCICLRSVDWFSLLSRRAGNWL